MKTYFILSALVIIISLTLAVACVFDWNDDQSKAYEDKHEIWADSLTGLTWQVEPSGDHMTWDDAKTYCNNLSLGGDDDWRLPTISELRSLIRGCNVTETGGACGVMDDCLDSSCWDDPCGGCESLAGPGSGGAYWPSGMSGEIGWYWSSSPVYIDGGYRAWLVDFSTGHVDYYYVDYGNGVRCVR
jgi:hypothetical protein